METQTFTELELTEASLRTASGVWLDYRNRSERCLNLDSQLLLKRTQAMARIDQLLEQYFTQFTLDGLDDGIPTTG